jgi:hypothetical protein
MSQRSPPHMKMMTIKKHLTKCVGRLDKVLKNGSQVCAMASEVDVTIEQF